MCSVMDRKGEDIKGENGGNLGRGRLANSKHSLVDAENEIHSR